MQGCSDQIIWLGITNIVLVAYAPTTWLTAPKSVVRPRSDTGRRCSFVPFRRNRSTKTDRYSIGFHHFCQSSRLGRAPSRLDAMEYIEPRRFKVRGHILTSFEVSRLKKPPLLVLSKLVSNSYDKLPAFVTMTRNFHELTGNRYVVGLWEEKLTSNNHFLWSASVNGIERIIGRPETYKVPS